MEARRARREFRGRHRKARSYLAPLPTRFPALYRVHYTSSSRSPATTPRRERSRARNGARIWPRFARIFRRLRQSRRNWAVSCSHIEHDHDDGAMAGNGGGLGGARGVRTERDVLSIRAEVRDGVLLGGGRQRRTQRAGEGTRAPQRRTSREPTAESSALVTNPEGSRYAGGRLFTALSVCRFGVRSKVSWHPAARALFRHAPEARAFAGLCER